MKLFKFYFQVITIFCLLILLIISIKEYRVLAICTFISIPFAYVYLKKWRSQYKESIERIKKSKRLLRLEKRQKLINPLIQFFKINRCKKCNSANLSFRKFNDDYSAMYIICSQCKKEWWALSKESSINAVSKLIDERKVEIAQLSGLNFIKFQLPKEDNIINPLKGYKRHSISQSVKDKVWNRDDGKCVECGSNENLEFDHIIPVSKGGANTYRNIQLLCEPCNRTKSAKIG